VAVSCQERESHTLKQAWQKVEEQRFPEACFVRPCGDNVGYARNGSQLAFVTTVLVAWGKAEVDPYSTFSVRLDLDNETKRGENRRLLHFAWNFGSARKRQGSEAVRHDEDLLISSQPDVGYCLQASLITVLPVCSGPPSGGKKRRDRSHE